MRAPVDQWRGHPVVSFAARAAGIAGIRIERLEDTARQVVDQSSLTPELMALGASIPGMVDLRRAMYLYWLAYNGGAGDIIEIGSWQGRSTFFLARACIDSDNGRVHAIEPGTGNPGREHLYEVDGQVLGVPGLVENLERCHVADRVTVWASTSESAAGPVLDQVSGVRMLFIDGDHRYDAVRQDLRLFADALTPGGLLVLDDYSTAHPGVVRAWREHLDTHPDRYLRPVQDDGMLMVRRRHSTRD